LVSNNYVYMFVKFFLKIKGIISRPCTYILVASVIRAIIARSSETMVNFCQTTWRYNPEDSHLFSYCQSFRVLSRRDGAVAVCEDRRHMSEQCWQERVRTSDRRIEKITQWFVLFTWYGHGIRMRWAVRITRKGNYKCLQHFVPKTWRKVIARSRGQRKYADNIKMNLGGIRS
jgi:hypothetical protein